MQSILEQRFYGERNYNLEKECRFEEKIEEISWFEELSNIKHNRTWIFIFKFRATVHNALTQRAPLWQNAKRYKITKSYDFGF